MSKAKFVKYLRLLSLWLFWPGVFLVSWGELTPNPPQMSGVLAWDKADHFIAYLGLAGMATLVIGLKPRLKWAILAVILMSGALEILQGFLGRDADILDFAANTLGAITGTTLGALFLILFQGRATLVAGDASD
jgi:VanZ family protein